MLEALALIGGLALLGLLLFQGHITYALTDGAAINRLAALQCPSCDKIVGRESAREAAEAIGRENDGIATIQGGYVPSTSFPVWSLTCPDCGIALSYHVAGNTLRRKHETHESG